jgi:Kef-type K+ transport system membrane component KefB/nucleotide-binding universal stress UspA family protein
MHGAEGLESTLTTTFALAVLLGAGLLGAKLAQLLRLPSVTGFICTGLLLGPSGLNLIKEQHLSENLAHFAEIALMLIAFGIGAHLDWRHLRKSIRSVGYASVFESWGACLLVAGGTFAAAWLTQVGPDEWTVKEYVCLAALLGGVATATAPAATFHVMRELRASGPLTRTLMAVVALDDGLAIIIFGVVLAVVGTVVGAAGAGLLTAIGHGILESLGSVLIGLVCGVLIDLFVHRLKRRGEMLTAGLALILLTGEASRMLGLSPLLAGMAAGFAIVNRDRRDVRVFRTINDFEPPIYALFFTLAGAHLRLSALIVAGAVGLVYAVFRPAGKMLGAYIGSRIASAPEAVRKYLGFALVPQAGVAIGLVFLIQADPELSSYADIITPVVLAGVVLSELVGPVSAKFAVTRAGEVGGAEAAPGEATPGPPPSEVDKLEFAPWTWPQLSPTEPPSGETVIFGVRHPRTAAPVCRISTLLAHFYDARPLAVRVMTEVGRSEYEGSRAREETQSLFESAEREAAALGYPLLTDVEFSEDIPDGLVNAARAHRAKAIVLGHPIGGGQRAFRRVVDRVAERAEVPVVVVRFEGPLHTERILVPFGDPDELEPVCSLVYALSAVAEHEVTLLHLMPSGTERSETDRAEAELGEWVAEHGIHDPVRCRAVATDSRLHSITEEAASHDIIIMALDRTGGLRRAFFGSLAGEVGLNCHKPVLLIGGKTAASVALENGSVDET